MPGPILPVSAATLPEAIRPAGSPAAGGAFQDVFTSAIQKVEADRMSIEINPRRLRGPWDDGYALDVHTRSSTFLGYDQYGHHSRPN